MPCRPMDEDAFHIPKPQGAEEFQPQLMLVDVALDAMLTEEGVVWDKEG